MIVKRVTSKGKLRYYIYISAGSNVKKYVGVAKTARAAEELERSAESKQWQIRNGLRTIERTDLFADLAMPWAESRGDIQANGQPRKSAWKRDWYNMRNHIVPFWGARPISECGSLDLVREFVAELLPKMSGTNAGHMLTLLSRFFNELPDDLRQAIGNPVRLLDRCDRPRKSHDPRTTPFLEDKAHIRALLDSLRPMVREVYATCVLAGVRPGEALALRPEDVRLERSHIKIERAYKDKAAPGSPKVGPVKNHQSRLVPINSDLKEILRAYLPARLNEGQEGSPYLFPARKIRTGGSGMMTPHSLQDEFNETRARLRLPQVTFYQASRHTYASHYVMDGGSIEQLCKILGQSSVQVTERYAHLRPEHFVEHDFRSMLGLAEPRTLRVVKGEP